MSSLEMELEQGEESLSDDILNLSAADIQARTRLLDNEVILMECLFNPDYCLSAAGHSSQDQATRQ